MGLRTRVERRNGTVVGSVFSDVSTVLLCPSFLTED